MPSPLEIWGAACVFYAEFGDPSSVTLVDGLTSAFTDKASGTTYTQATAGSRFAYQATGYGGGGAVLMASGKTFTFPQPANFPSGNAPHTMIVVGRYTASNAYPTPFAYGGREVRKFRSMSARNRRVNAGFFGDDHESSALGWANVERMVVSIVDGSDPTKSWLFNSPTTSEMKTLGGPLATPTTSTVEINRTADSFDGPVRAIVLLNRVATVDELTQANTYFASAYTPPSSGGTTVTANGTSTGTSTVTGQASTQNNANGSAAGTSTATGQTSTTATANGSALGTSTVQGQASVIVQVIGTAFGSSNALGAASIQATANGTAAGTSTADGKLSATATANGSAAGTSTANGTSGSTASADVVGTAAGGSTASGQLIVAITTTGTAQGSSNVQGKASTAVTLNGSATGTSTAQAKASTQVTSNGTASGSSTGTGRVTTVVTLNGVALGGSTVLGNAMSAVTVNGRAAGTSVAIGQAKVSGGLIAPDIPWYRVHLVANDPRLYLAPPDARIHVVGN